MIEVEAKFRVCEGTDLRVCMAELVALGAEEINFEEQADHYLAHPQRDFKTTDEALRIRVTDEQSWITYKGPKQVSGSVKSRSEIEVPLARDQGAEKLSIELFTNLGFLSVAVVRKARRSWHVAWNGEPLTVAFDEVKNLGKFVEIECVVDDHRAGEAERLVAELAQHLGLAQPVRESYLELLLRSGSG